MYMYTVCVSVCVCVCMTVCEFALSWFTRCKYKYVICYIFVCEERSKFGGRVYPVSHVIKAGYLFSYVRQCLSL